MIEFNYDIAGMLKDQFKRLYDVLGTIRTRLNNVVRDGDYLGTDDALKNIDKIIELHDDLLAFVSRSLLLYEKLAEDIGVDVKDLNGGNNSVAVNVMFDELVGRYGTVAQTDQLWKDLDYWYGGSRVHDNGCGPSSITNELIISFNITDPETIKGLYGDILDLMLHRGVIDKNSILHGGAPEAINDYLTGRSKRNDKYATLNEVIDSYDGDIVYAGGKASEIIKYIRTMTFSDTNKVMLVGKMNGNAQYDYDGNGTPDEYGAILAMAQLLYEKGVDTNITFGYGAAGTNTSGRPFQGGSAGHYIGFTLNTRTFIDEGVIYITDSDPRNIVGENYPTEFKRDYPFSDRKYQSTFMKFNANYEVTHMNDTVLKVQLKDGQKFTPELLQLINVSGAGSIIISQNDFGSTIKDYTAQFNEGLASYVPTYDLEPSYLAIGEDSELASVITSLSAHGRTTEVKQIDTATGKATCVVSVPNYDEYHGESVGIVVYAPGATELSEGVSKLEHSQYMQGIFSANYQDETFNSVIVVPVSFGSINFETDGAGLNDEAYNRYAAFVNEASHTTYTNSAGQTVSVDPSRVTLAGFSVGSKKQAEFVRRLISTNPEYAQFQANLGDVQFEQVILASSGKGGIDKLCGDIEAGRVDQARLEDFQGKFVYLLAQNDEHDMKDVNGRTYTEYNRSLMDAGLIDIELSEAYMDGLLPEEIAQTTSQVYRDRTSFIAQKAGYTGHESAREGIIGVLSAQERLRDQTPSFQDGVQRAIRSGIKSASASNTTGSVLKASASTRPTSANTQQNTASNLEQTEQAPTFDSFGPNEPPKPVTSSQETSAQGDVSSNVGVPTGNKGNHANTNGTSNYHFASSPNDAFSEEIIGTDQIVDSTQASLNNEPVPPNNNSSKGDKSGMYKKVIGGGSILAAAAGIAGALFKRKKNQEAVQNENDNDMVDFGYGTDDDYSDYEDHNNFNG